MNFVKKITIKKLLTSIIPAVGAFFIAVGWSYYHLDRRDHLHFAIKALILTTVIFIFYYAIKFLFWKITNKFNKHPFWTNEFYHQLDSLFLVFSLSFLVYFFHVEIFSLIYFALILLAIFWRVQSVLVHHPNALVWKKINQLYFELFLFVFIFSAICQYWNFNFAVVETQKKVYDIVLFRAWSISMVWLGLYAFFDLVYWRVKKLPRLLTLTAWPAAFFASMIIWAINAGILFFSGLNLSPVILQHANGASSVISNKISGILMLLLVVISIIFFFIYKKIFIARSLVPKLYWDYHNFALLFVAISSLMVFSSLKTTPEYNTFKNFYNYFYNNQTVELNPIVQKKLERFGLKYNLENFNLIHNEEIFTATSTPLLPKTLQKNPPNIVIIFLESFSARLTDVYNDNLQNLTPGLKKMSGNKNTTIFRNYYNASTPTVTGLLSQLCSILPSTGHEEISTGENLQRHHLLCLPKILKRNGYEYSTYITAVEKDYANKDIIFGDMGVDKVYGTDELSAVISGEPLSWGYSDHQLFPATYKMMTKNTNQPFLMMLSSVDTHQPFNLSKDMVNFGDGKNDLLNSFHSTDDAFLKFWENFVSSTLYDNTIVIAIADHAIFPGNYIKYNLNNSKEQITFYDENAFLMYIPNNILPKTINTYSSGLDFTPTILNLLDINTPNSFEGHSIFDDRIKYPNVLGTHEFGLYINQLDKTGKRMIDYSIPSHLDCSDYQYDSDTTKPLTLCEFLNYYEWKKKVFADGRFWEK